MPADEGVQVVTQTPIYRRAWVGASVGGADLSTVRGGWGQGAGQELSWGCSDTCGSILS